MGIQKELGGTGKWELNSSSHLPHFQACVFALTQKSHSVAVWGEGRGEGNFFNSLIQEQHHFLTDTKALHKTAEAFPNNSGECTVKVLRHFFLLVYLG